MTNDASLSGLRRLVALMALIVALFFALSRSERGVIASMPTGPLGPGLNWLAKVESRVLSDVANGDSTQFIVLMSRRADLSKAYSMRDQDARGWYVYSQLKGTADSSQAGIL